MPLFTGSGQFGGSTSGPNVGGQILARGWYVTRWILRRSPPAAAAVLAGNAVYFALEHLNSNDDEAHVAGRGGPGGYRAELSMPPMWARDP